MKLDNETALVTGASRGIGRAIVLELGRRGARVVGTATSERGAENIDNYMKENKIEGSAQVLDVRDQASVDALFSALKTSDKLPSILVNNAGITRDNLLLRMKVEEWSEIIETNLNSVFRLCKACLRAMMKARRGRIINIASVVAATGNPGQANYAAAKAGMIGFSKSLAREVASRGITVNAVAPGFIATDMTDQLPDDQKATLLNQIPAGRLGHPEEVAAVVAFLASEVAAYITGATIHVNGGMHMA